MPDETARSEGEEEMGEWRVILDHVDALYPIFAERGYSRDACLSAWIAREQIQADSEDDE